MADFLPCYEKVLELEGWYKLHNIPGDRGGLTYAGISKVNWPSWEGWVKIDAIIFDESLKTMVQNFYRKEFWFKIRGDYISSQKIAFLIYDFAVNAGLKTSIKLCQEAIGAKVDGFIGPNTLKALNETNEVLFLSDFSLLKVFYYNDICLNDNRRKQDRVSSNLKFLCGWLNRVKEGVK